MIIDSIKNSFYCKIKTYIHHSYFHYLVIIVTPKMFILTCLLSNRNIMVDPYIQVIVNVLMFIIKNYSFQIILHIILHKKYSAMEIEMKIINYE